MRGQVQAAAPQADDANAATADAAGGTAGAETAAEARTGSSAGTTRIDFPRPSRPSALEASPDGNWLAVGTSFGDIYLADTRTGES